MTFKHRGKTFHTIQRPEQSDDDLYDLRKILHLDTKANYVPINTMELLIPQEDGEYPPYAIVMGSWMSPRDPRMVDEQLELRRTFGRNQTFQGPVWYDRDGMPHAYIYCSGCGDWQRPDAFGPDKRKANGRRSSCRTCENHYDRQRYHQRSSKAA